MFNKGMGNMQGMLKKVQKMQADMQKMQEELKQRTVEASAGGGSVTVVMNGEKVVESITIDPAAVDPEDVEMLEDIIVSAVNEAGRKVDDMMAQEMGKVTGGMNIPGLF
ncbi:MAG: YbaB/EbfC family nucleoid-associated protein [Veillonella sp.]|uniref:YbaB/EbfC family nucleoid-associated protein n=1 Tax=Veillonella sp. TaxID=1926307 RepID=UPI0025F4C7EF|nr:YbaB/EbfC family nucleoid-associated protein [Veillonella sp.]MBS4913124.1 YbaB/EbfC family nucleoid-associated protein [Veillonella sp.]